MSPIALAFIPFAGMAFIAAIAYCAILLLVPPPLQVLDRQEKRTSAVRLTPEPTTRNQVLLRMIEMVGAVGAIGAVFSYLTRFRD